MVYKLGRAAARSAQSPGPPGTARDHAGATEGEQAAGLESARSLRRALLSGRFTTLMSDGP